MKHVAIMEERGNPTPRYLVQGYVEPEDLAEAIEVLIAMLDEATGDPDLEGEWSEDELSTVPSYISLEAGPGCAIADAGGGAVDDEGEAIDEREQEQLLDDVPMLAVRTLEGEIVGYSNLQSSFQTNGSVVRSADTGELLVTRGWSTKPGSPV